MSQTDPSQTCLYPTRPDLYHSRPTGQASTTAPGAKTGFTGQNPRSTRPPQRSASPKRVFPGGLVFSRFFSRFLRFPHVFFLQVFSRSAPNPWRTYPRRASGRRGAEAPQAPTQPFPPAESQSRPHLETVWMTPSVTGHDLKDFITFLVPFFDFSDFL